MKSSDARLLHVLDSVSPKGISLRAISQELWTFLGLFGLNGDLLKGRDRDAEPNNGIELWRFYYDKAKGIAQEVDDHGFVRLINFPQAKSERDLEPKIAEWERLFYLHGKGISPSRKKLMFAEILPDNLKRELSCKYSFPDFESMHRHIMRAVRYDHHQEIIKTSSHNKLYSVEQSPEVPMNNLDKTIADLTSQVQKLAGVNGRGKGRGRTEGRAGGKDRSRSTTPRGRPKHDLSYTACWHCGGTSPEQERRRLQEDVRGPQREAEGLREHVRQVGERRQA